MPVDTLDDLFEYRLQGAYYVEKRLVDALDELQTSATNGKLVDGFAEHRDETVHHVERLQTVFDAAGIPREERNVPSVDGLLEEKRAFDAAARDEDLQNLFYVELARKNEQLEITTYDGLIDLAERLNLGGDAVEQLRRTKREEEKTLEKLERIGGGSEFDSLFDRLR